MNEELREEIEWLRLGGVGESKKSTKENDLFFVVLSRTFDWLACVCRMCERRSEDRGNDVVDYLSRLPFAVDLRIENRSKDAVEIRCESERKGERERECTKAAPYK